MRLGWNLLAGFTSSAWSAVVSVLATPFYLHYLGIESYGLIGFFTTLLALLQLLDFGLTPTMNREVARHAAVGDVGAARHLLRSLEWVYWLVALALGAFFLLTASWIGQHWLQSAHLQKSEIVHAVMLMGLVVAVRWPVGLYTGTLMGAQQLAVVSAISIVMVTSGALGAILTLSLLAPTIQAFFMWQAGVGLIHVLAIRRFAWARLGGGFDIRFKMSELRRISRFSIGLGVISLTGAFIMQFDKILLSRMVGLGPYGRYMLASMLASGLYLFVMPIFNVIYPRFSALIVGGYYGRLVDLYGVATRLLATLVFPIATAASLYAEPLVRLWTHDPMLASKVAPIVSLLMLGSALHGIMFLPYALQLAYGKSRLALAINIGLAILYVPLAIVMAIFHGGIGVAWAWFILHAFFLLAGSWITHLYLLNGTWWRWLTRDVGIPLCSTLAVAFLVSKTGYVSSGHDNQSILWSCVLVVMASFTSIALSPALRSSLAKYFIFSMKARDGS
jgi:O-antigen/teichoic acid export membrane protein